MSERTETGCLRDICIFQFTSTPFTMDESSCNQGFIREWIIKRGVYLLSAKLMSATQKVTNLTD